VNPGFAKGRRGSDHSEPVEREPVTGPGGRAAGGGKGSEAPEAERFWFIFIQKNCRKLSI